MTDKFLTLVPDNRLNDRGFRHPGKAPFPALDKIFGLELEIPQLEQSGGLDVAKKASDEQLAPIYLESTEDIHDAACKELSQIHAARAQEQSLCQIVREGDDTVMLPEQRTLQRILTECQALNDNLMDHGNPIIRAIGDFNNNLLNNLQTFVYNDLNERLPV